MTYVYVGMYVILNEAVHSCCLKCTIVRVKELKNVSGWKAVANF